MRNVHDQRDAALALIEVMEIKSENTHIENLQRTSYEELRKLLHGAAPDWLFGLILDARQRVRDEYSRKPNH